MIYAATISDHALNVFGLFVAVFTAISVAWFAIESYRMRK